MCTYLRNVAQASNCMELPKAEWVYCLGRKLHYFHEGADMRGVLPDLPGDGERGYFKALQFAVTKTCLQIAFI